MQANYVQRLRITFGKAGPTRFIGHLDLARTLERSLNRASIPLAYTQGYNRRPRMQFAAALPLGFTSECEIADLWLAERLEPERAQLSIDQKMAPGIYLKSVEDVDLKAPAMQTLVTEAIYEVTFMDPHNWSELAERINQLMATDKLERERRGKKYDLRPLILELRLIRDGDEPILKIRLSLLPGKTGRPDEVVDQLGIDPLGARIHRRNLVLSEPDKQ